MATQQQFTDEEKELLKEMIRDAKRKHNTKCGIWEYEYVEHKRKKDKYNVYINMYGVVFPPKNVVATMKRDEYEAEKRVKKLEKEILELEADINLWEKTIEKFSPDVHNI